MEMWDAWANGKKPRSAIPGFPDLFPMASGASNIPISYPNTPLGYPTISAHFAGTPYESHPQVLASSAASNIFTAAPCSATTQPALPRPNFDSSSFTFQAPSFPVEPHQFPTYTYPQPPQFEFTAGQEKTTKTPEQEEIVRKMRSMEQSLKSIQGLSGQKSASYADLCMFPHVHLPLGFKTPKFEKYNGHGDPIAHLKRYCNQLRGAGGQVELLMAYFGESLVGIAFEWYMDQDISRWYIWDDLARDFVRQFQYNIDIAPDRNSLTNLKNKSSESFGEYAVKWREQASRVKPLMDEVEMVTVFLQAQEADYFQNMMSAMGKPFAEAIKIGEMGGSGGIAKRKKREETFMAVSGARRNCTPRSLFSERAPQHYYAHQDLAYTLQPYSVMNAQPYVRPQQQASRNQAPFPRNQPPYQTHYNPRPPQNNFHPHEPSKRPNFTPIGKTYSSLLPNLVQMGLLQPVPQTRQNPASPAYKAGTRCAYHSGVEGHDTYDCWTLKRVVDNLIEQRKIVLRDEDVPNVTNNPLPAHNNGPIIGMICKDKEFDPALKAINAIADKEKKQKAVSKQDKGEKNKETTPPKSEKKIEVETGATPPKDVVLYIPQGRKEKQMTLSPPRRFELNRTTQMYVPKGVYVMRGPIKSSRLNEPVVIGCAPQKPMKDPTAVPWNYNKTVVTYKGKEIPGEVQENNPVEKYSNLEEVNNATRKSFPLKKPVSAEETEAFFQNMKTADYEVIDQLRKFPKQVSLLALLMNSTEHQKVLIKTLNEAYVPVDISVEQLKRMAERFFAINQITFSKNDLPSEGAAHNKSLHLTVKCKGHYVKRVMFDGGSGVDICHFQLYSAWKLGPK
ncbi:uncharacterized protein [Nicotiana sylvestris]|uniref:uncharacterized protein n=1 Tax=Nicotiana sylvestris TaxID=4096 RepID=UPI00388CB8EB